LAVKKILVQKDPIDIKTIIDEAGSDADGSIVYFIGRVRNKSKDGREVRHIEYDIYNGMANLELVKIADEAISANSLTNCIIVHRYGIVDVGETSVFIAVSSPHRKASYAASMFIIDAIKTRVPIWKKEVYADGSEWLSETP
jgi:molybdopterin synthase catalytic subunit